MHIYVHSNKHNNIYGIWHVIILQPTFIHTIISKHTHTCERTHTLFIIASIDLITLLPNHSGIINIRYGKQDHIHKGIHFVINYITYFVTLYLLVDYITTSLFMFIPDNTMYYFGCILKKAHVILTRTIVVPE